MGGKSGMKAKGGFVVTPVIFPTLWRCFIFLSNGLEFPNNRRIQFASETCRKFRFQLFPQLVNVADGQVPEIEIVGKKRPCSGFRDFMDETSPTRPCSGFDKPLGFQNAHRLADGAFSHAEKRHELGFVRQFVAGLKRFGDNKFFDGFSYLQGRLARLSATFSPIEREVACDM